MTTITIDSETEEALKKLKITEDESYNSVIERLVKRYKQEILK